MSLTRTIGAIIGLGTAAITACTGHTSTTSSAPAPNAASGTALAALNTLKVAPLTTISGYTRAQFGEAWTDNQSALWGHNRCDTRDDILRRDLSSIRVKGSGTCVIASGVLNDPYTGTVINFTRGERTSAAVQIDHRVALGDAWQTGASSWSKDKRTQLANDPLELGAVASAPNEQKGDKDAASWLPQKKDQCFYVASQISVKKAYGLWVTPSEKKAMQNVLASCPSQKTISEPGSQSHL